MASEELIKTFQGYEQYAREKGLTEEIIGAMIQACETAFKIEKDREYGLKISKKIKNYIAHIIYRQTGGTIWQVEKYAYENKLRYGIMDKWFEVLKLEAQERIFDSYMMYLERKRDPKDRFYMPKRKQFLEMGIVDVF